MINLLLSVLCSVIIANLLRFFYKDSQIKDKFVFLGNYLLASIFSLFMIKSMHVKIVVFDISTGILSGFLFLAGLIVYKKSISVNGLSLSVSAMRVSLIIPTIVAVFFFKEYLFLLNIIGILLIIISFIYLPDYKIHQGIFWLFLLFTITGIADLSLKIYDTYGQNEQGFFLFIIFVTAFLFNLIWIIFTKTAFSLKSFLYGLLLGIPNQLTTFFFLKAISDIPASIAYPLTSSMVVLFSLLSDTIIWRKEFSRKQKIAFFFLLCGVILLNIS